MNHLQKLWAVKSPTYSCALSSQAAFDFQGKLFLIQKPRLLLVKYPKQPRFNQGLTWKEVNDPWEGSKGQTGKPWKPR